MSILEIDTVLKAKISTSVKTYQKWLINDHLMTHFFIAFFKDSDNMYTRLIPKSGCAGKKAENQEAHSKSSASSDGQNHSPEYDTRVGKAIFRLSIIVEKIGHLEKF